MGLISDAAVSRGDLGREQAEVKRDLEAARSARRAEHTSISADSFSVHGGKLIVDQNGELQVITADGTILVSLGALEDFNGLSRGWRLNYEDGTRALALGGTTGRQVWQAYDLAGNYIMTSDGVSGKGLARPYLNYRVVPTTSAESVAPRALWPSTTSTTGIGLLEGYNVVWHPKLAYRVVTITSDGGGMDWAIKFDDVIAATGSNTQQGQVDTPGWGDTTDPGPPAVNITVEAVLTGSATRGWLQVTALCGCESFDF